MKQSSGPLVISADPGCGKSVLAKYLVDDILPGNSTTCYFFFKDQDQNTIRQALCALLHQLFRAKPFLIKYAMKPFRQNGEDLRYSTRSLWQILRKAIRDPRAGPVIIVLDALDECAEVEFENLVRNVRSHCSYGDNLSDRGSVKFLLTSRPYDRVIGEFYTLLESFPKIRVPGEEASKIIGREINLVIMHRLTQLSRQKGLTTTMESELKKALRKTKNRTYLWVSLVFDYLKKCNFRRTPNGIKSALAVLPSGVDEAYERILEKCQEPWTARKILSVMLAAKRPLTVQEANIIMNLDEQITTFHGMDLEEENDFKKRLRQLCGLFVSVHHGRIYFLHQTAREFLVDKSGLLAGTSPPGGWHHSIHMKYAHTVLAKECLFYLQLLNTAAIDIYSFIDLELDFPDMTTGQFGDDVRYRDFALVDYAARHWLEHFKEAGCTADGDIRSHIRSVFEDNSKCFFIWFGIYEGFNRSRHSGLTGLRAASYF